MEMTIPGRIEDISKRCGLSEEIVRRVLNAEQESVIESLKQGNRATLVGRCTFTPSMSKQIVDGQIRNRIYIKVRVSKCIQNELDILEDYEEDKEETGLNEIPDNIKIIQIPGLV